MVPLYNKVAYTLYPSSHLEHIKIRDAKDFFTYE